MPFREGSSQPQVGLLSTPTVSSVPGEYNFFSAVAKVIIVIITAGASRYCILMPYSYELHLLVNSLAYPARSVAGFV